MADVLMTRAAKLLLLADLIDVGGLLTGAKLMLWKGDSVPTENTVYADLVKPVFTGYADSAVLTWHDPIIDGNTGEPTLTADPITFRSIAGAPFVGDVANGMAIYFPGAPNLLRLVQRFDEMLVISEAEQEITVQPFYPGRASVSI